MPEPPLKEYPWSSWSDYLKRPGKRRDWLRVDRVLGEWNIKQDNAVGRRQLEPAMEQRKELDRSQASGGLEKLRRDESWGPKESREKLLEMIAETSHRQPMARN